MKDALTELPLAQRRAFCERLLADRIGSWVIYRGMIVVAQDDHPPYVIRANGVVQELRWCLGDGSNVTRFGDWAGKDARA